MFVCVHACMPLVLTNFLCLLPPLFLFLSMWILQKPLILWSAGPRILAMWQTDRQTDRIQTDRPTDTHRSTCTFHLLQWEKKNENVASIRVFFSSGLLLKPLENPPTTAAVHQSRPNERHYTLQSVWFKDDLQPFASAARSRKTFLEISSESICNIQTTSKGFKLCIGCVAVGSVQIGFYQMSEFP